MDAYGGANAAPKVSHGAVAGSAQAVPDIDGKNSRSPVPEAQPGTARYDDHPSARSDLAWLVVAMAVAVFLSIHFELSEALLAWTRPWERYQLDELPGVLLFLALALAWFSWRRMREARAVLAARVALERDLAHALADNRRLARSMVQIQEEERRSLAREMHDELGQHLNAIKIDAVTIRDGAGGDSAMYAAAASIVRVTDRVHGIVRDIMRKLRPAGLDELGLTAALENQVEEWRTRHAGVAVDLQIGGDVEALGEALNMLVYRIVQEALTNVARHAAARSVSVNVAISGRELQVEVRDDGNGAAALPARSGLGLVGMRERVEAAGGKLVAGGAAGNGFSVSARIPLGRHD